MQDYARRIAMKPATIVLVLSLLLNGRAAGQSLPSRWDELIASDWPSALAKSESTCILPIGILEKHGPHAAIGCDLIHVREWAARVTRKEYAVVFPDYFYGQIYEAKHQPGTFALPSRLVWDLLDATCEEIARNGLKKILIVNGHGGNLNRLSLPDLYTGIWWYADFPNHYAGEGDKATKALGELLTEHSIESLLRALRVVKADRKTKVLQNEFFDRVLK